MNVRHLAGAMALATTPCAWAQPDCYQVTINVSQTLQNVFVYADEWNGHVYAWDLFPAALGTVGPGPLTFSLGSRNIKAWAIIANTAAGGVAAGINQSLDTPPDGQSFEVAFPGYSQPIVAGNIQTLYNGAYNVTQAFYLFEYVLAMEDTLKTDRPSGTLDFYTFSPSGHKVGSAALGVCPSCPCVADFDQSGGTPDAGDIDMYFNAWLAGDAAADADCSGGTPDANDIDQFFSEWLAGGC